MPRMALCPAAGTGARRLSCAGLALRCCVAGVQVKKARLLANPGCYPTCSQLPLYPLIKSKLITADDIIIDAKSGESAGAWPA
jgi:hypothetical protein